MNTPSLRIALLLSGDLATRFQADIAHFLCDLSVAPMFFSLPWLRRGPGLLFSLYQRLDRLLAPVAVDPFAPADLPGGLRIRELPDTAQWAHELGRMARADRLDLLIVPGDLEIPPGLPAAFRHGLLVLDFLDFASQAPVQAFAALADPASCWEPRLVWHTAKQPPRLLYRSASAVFPLSLSRTAAPACVTAARFVPRMVRELQDGGPQAWEARATPLEAAPPAAIPGNAAMRRFLFRLARRAAATAWRDIFFRPQWFLALRRGGGDPFDLGGFTPAFPPDASGWADPFPFVRDGVTHLFFEHIDKDTGHGRIAVMTQAPDGTFGPPHTVLHTPHHLSYPFVFEWGGEVYMVPESAQAARVELFRAVRFPLEWEPAATLLPGVRAVDSTLFEHEGRWWLMANLRLEGGSSWDELSVFYADSPLGPFVPHPGNPVVSDVRRSRPAGRVFRHGGRLYRPAQDCSGHYGRALAILEIETLTPRAYRETEVARHEAAVLGQGDSLHTYNSVPGLEAVDGHRYIPRLTCPRRRPGG
ncbi:glycoside hydrolase family 43 protein [Desulfovibrio sulfodismutans]|uniref:Glycoside hydrolase family 43 protein n=1 Tax=Desulfolutivibrio sulfodismutans TaxID=63561 RepID=A0A7K3NMR3_9BACT|nr:glycoside hydrolase family 43 protein [Desulfolutivibrio sulfodismutans]NDY57055.1 glycoside hydrolase family 43 protein [Desulfolutivibrio sulfodismutans]QLA12486.1 hypothetical protein GD606_09480 [Desulfolutivibrio sulfodismutans DSM 3696]